MGHHLKNGKGLSPEPDWSHIPAIHHQKKRGKQQARQVNRPMQFTFQRNALRTKSNDDEKAKR